MTSVVEHEPISSLKVGVTGCCPECGKGHLFSGFLTIAKKCDACGLDLSFADSGDGPAVFVILIVGFIIVGAALLVEVNYEPPLWVHAVLWPPLLLILSLSFLRFLKAGLVALQYRNDARQGRLIAK